MGSQVFLAWAFGFFAPGSLPHFWGLGFGISAPGSDGIQMYTLDVMADIGAQVVGPYSTTGPLLQGVTPRVYSPPQIFGARFSSWGLSSCSGLVHGGLGSCYCPLRVIAIPAHGLLLLGPMGYSTPGAWVLGPGFTGFWGLGSPSHF